MRKRIAQRVANTREQAGQLDPTVQGLLWTTAAGLLFVCLNTIQRIMTQQLDPFQSQFLRYACGLLVMMPLVLRAGFAAYRRAVFMVFRTTPHPTGRHDCHWLYRPDLHHAGGLSVF